MYNYYNYNKLFLCATMHPLPQYMSRPIYVAHTLDREVTHTLDREVTHTLDREVTHTFDREVTNTLKREAKTE